MELSPESWRVSGAAAALGLLLWLLTHRALKAKNGSLRSPPAVPGWPVIGNLHQMKGAVPHILFTKWARKYGPLYTIKTGTTTLVVVTSSELAREVMVTRFPSFSTRKLSWIFMLATADKWMVAMADYGERHKLLKRYYLSSVLNPNSQKRFRCHRDSMIESMLHELHEQAAGAVVSIRSMLKREALGLAMKQAVGKNYDTLYIKEMGGNLPKTEIYDVLVADLLLVAGLADWRDFFPYLSWLPNKSVEKKVNDVYTRRNLVTTALINLYKKRQPDHDEEHLCYLRFLLEEAQELSEMQLLVLIWEALLESSDTTPVVVEWAMYELAKNHGCQESLYEEIKSVCGDEKVTEENLPHMPYLNAVFHETLRKHSPVPIMPLKYAHKDTEIGGYHIHKGSQIAINIYGAHRDEKEWEDPEVWKPERFLTGKHQLQDMHKTLAFGLGRRACAGSMQAMNISCTAVARMAQEFKWTLKEGQGDDDDTVLFTTHKLQPLEAYITPRSTL
ncbi:hypothetical protein AMTRI_Chr05g68740 [Amborella trichopoda]